MKKVKNCLNEIVSFVMKKLRYFKKNYKNSKVLKISLVILLALIFLFSIGITVGRYVYLELRDYYFASKNFYFNSDKLDVNLARYQIDNWSGADSYSITFNMNSYKNNNVYATSKIDYDIEYSCSTNIICDISKNSGSISVDKHTDSFVVTITPNANFEDGDSVWLEVTATSSYPYEKTLSGRFVIKVGKLGLSYEIVDKVGSPYLDLNITNTLDYYLVKEAFDSYEVGNRLDISTYLNLSAENKSKCASAIITLDFDPDVVKLDMTNDKYLVSFNKTYETLNNFQYVNGFSFKVDALSSAVVRFYKSDTTLNYTYPFDNTNSVIGVTYN